MIAIVDYGMGNLGSIFNMFKKVGAAAKITSDFNAIKNASKIVLPGVGAFDNAMRRLNESGLSDLLNFKALEEGVPFLGICLGMQLLTESSEEGRLSGLGLFPAKTIKFCFNKEDNLKIPHMGWNIVEKTNPGPLTKGFSEDARFYFVHSYYVRVENEKNSILKTKYGIEFDSGIQKDNIFGVQFHPEKSHKFGMKLFENFIKI